MIRLVGADLFKFLRRWMPYILLLLSCLYMAYLINIDYSLAKHSLESLSPLTYDDFAAALEQTDPNEENVTVSYSGDGFSGRKQLSRHTFDDVVLPEYIDGMFANMNYIVLFLIIMLVASFIGTEYQWGTLRQTLARGIGRNVYFGSKYITLAILIWLFVCGATLFLLIAGMVTNWLVTGGITWDFISTDTAGFLLSAMGLMTLIMIAYATLVALFSTLFKSTIVGLVVGVLYLQTENMVISKMLIRTGSNASIVPYYEPLPNPPEWLSYTIGYNTQYLLGHLSPTSSYGATFLNHTLTDLTQSVLVLAGYCAVFILISFLIFRKQELSSE